MTGKGDPAVMIAFEPPAPVAVPPSDPEIRQRLRLQSIGWALAAGISAGLLSLPWGLEAAVRSAGCAASACPYPLTTGRSMAWHHYYWSYFRPGCR